MEPSSFWNISNYKSMPSTQDTLRKLIETGNAQKEGLVINALEQTGGHGRHGRKWASGCGNLAFSFMLTPRASSSQNATLSLVTGIALTHAIKDFIKPESDDDIILKWPNDVILSGQKCAGILLENTEGHIIIGIGVNISCAPVEEAICLSQYCNKSHDINPQDMMFRFLEIFQSMYEQWQKHGFYAFKPEYMRLTYQKGRAVCVKLPKGEISGVFHDIDEGGNMLILCKDTQKLQKITAGDVFPV